jgi:hypothetical protein
MPVLRDLKIFPDRLNALRRTGLSGRLNKTRIQQMTRDLVDEYLQTTLFHPILIYEFHNICSVKCSRIHFDSDTFLTSEPIASTYPGAKAIAVAICTIGSDLEKRVRQLVERGEQLRGFALDAIGNAALDALAEETCAIVKKEAASAGYTASSPLSPGMPGIALAEQPVLFKLARANEADVTLTPQGFMVPAKSLSMLFCIGKVMPTWSKPEMCERCNLQQSCRYRLY